MWLNSQMVVFSIGMNTTLQKGKVALSPVPPLSRLIQTLIPIILNLGRIPKHIKWPDLPIEGSQGMDFKLLSDGYFDSQSRQLIT